MPDLQCGEVLGPEDDDEADACAAAGQGLAAQRLVVDTPGNGARLDRYLALHLPDVSRNRLQSWIEDGAVLLNGATARSRSLVYTHDRIDVVPPPAPESSAQVPQAMALAIVWQDADIIVLDKPAGLVVHPGAGNWSGTLLNGLLAHDPQLARVPRAGIVHRLDAGTSGLMVVARTVAAQLSLVRQLQEHSVVREYWALVSGAVAPRRTIDAALARDPRNPLRFRVSRAVSARPARTHVRCLAQWPLEGGVGAVSWVACRLETGRTHQIRVHLESVGHPLIGDPIYRRHFPGGGAVHDWLSHQALHACRLELRHPANGKEMAWSCAPPPDMSALLLRLGARAEDLRPPFRRFIEMNAPTDAASRRAGAMTE